MLSELLRALEETSCNHFRIEESIGRESRSLTNIAPTHSSNKTRHNVRAHEGCAHRRSILRTEVADNGTRVSLSPEAHLVHLRVMNDTTSPLPGPDLTLGVSLSRIPDGLILQGHAHGKPVVLARRGEELFAVGAYCSHYGAPLSEGLLVGDTIRC